MLHKTLRWATFKIDRWFVFTWNYSSLPFQLTLWSFGTSRLIQGEYLFWCTCRSGLKVVFLIMR